jgi:gluconokinase
MQDDSSLVLTIDIGSSSVRVKLFTSEGRRLEGVGSRTSYALRTTPDGGAELDPELMLDRIFAAIDRTLSRAGDMARRIAGVGVCSLVSNVLGLDSRGDPVTPIYTWADTRCAAEAEQLRDSMDEALVRERTGCYLHPTYLPARLLWLQRTMPDVYERTANWVSLGDLITLRLFGHVGQSLSVASWGGLLNRHTLDWDGWLLSTLNLDREKLPPLVDVDDTFSGLRPEYAERWPMLRHVPWLPCVGDGAASNVGSGCYTPDKFAVQIGTSAALRAIVPLTPAQVPHGLWCYRLDRHASVLGGALSEGGNVFNWLRHLLNTDDMASLEEAAFRLPPDSHGLTVLPLVAGERSPGWHTSARATITGLSLSTGQAELLRAAQESISYRLGIVYDLLAGELAPPSTIAASGGALLKVRGWLQMLADVLGRPVSIPTEPEASSRGVALLALRVLGLIPDFSALPTPMRGTYKPDMHRHAIYRRAMQRQQALYDLIYRTK